MNGLLGFKEVEEAIRELTTLKERQKLRETQAKLEATLKELEEKARQDEVVRKRLYEDACPTFFFDLLLRCEAVSDRALLEVKKGVDDLHERFLSIVLLRNERRNRSLEEEELEALIKTSKSLRKTLIKCFREMIEYLESLEG